MMGWLVVGLLVATGALSGELLRNGVVSKPGESAGIGPLIMLGIMAGLVLVLVGILAGGAQ
jgi:hypothetical protein